MDKLLNKTLTGRYRILAGFLKIFLVLSLITRIVLTAISFQSISFNPVDFVLSFLSGFFFDLIAFSYYALPIAIIIFLIPSVIARSKFYKGLCWFFYGLTIFIWTLNAFAEYFFWDEFEVRFNFIAVDYLVYTNEVIGNIVESYSIGSLIAIVACIAAIAIYWLVKNNYVDGSLKSDSTYLSRLKSLLLISILPLFAIFFVNINWSRISDNSYNNELAKNGFYSLFEAYKNNQLDYDRFYYTIDDKSANANVKALMTDSFISYSSSNLIYNYKNLGEEKRYNVMFITVESLSGEYLEYIDPGDGYEMPFLNQLVKKGLFFTNLYANGTRTVRGLEALNLSIPPTPGTSVVRRPSNDNLFSSGWLFHQKGYDNKFIYGGFGYFDNMNTFFSGNYFQIVDRSNYSEVEIRFANVWGTCDEDSYERAMKEADQSYKAGKPFFNFILTTSNHKPYTFPEVGLKLNKNRSGGVRYTDYALQKFFEEAPKHPWFKNTLFVIIGDHCGSSAGKSEMPILKYQIPCLIYAPELIQPMQVDKLCSQVDVVPTLAGIMNWSYESTFFGKNILTMTPNDERAFIGTYQKLGYIKGNKLMVLSPQKKFAQFSFDRYTGDMKEEKVESKFKTDAISIYQTAEHMFVKGLNKVDRLKNRSSK
ncbi:MAG: hypothetical protein RL516_1084 [Bacteroidota bacterium]|jgi:phosphoglycerol transferase MdoB-like AlkP superfamily enzyme